MKKLGIVFMVLALAAFVGCALFAVESFDKVSNYTNGGVNSYVNGDAYNYIINSGYFTAYAVYSVGLGLAGILLAGFGAIFMKNN